MCGSTVRSCYSPGGLLSVYSEYTVATIQINVGPNRAMSVYSRPAQQNYVCLQMEGRHIIHW